MTVFTQRRNRRTLFTAAVAIIAVIVSQFSGGILRPTGFQSGWILLGIVLFLSLYNVRKTVPFLPLGSFAAWLQVHIYAGLLSSVIFAIHIRFAIPNGLFECTLALIFVAVFASGVLGLYMTRTFPQRLTDLGTEVIFEQIPVVRHQVRDQIEQLVLMCGSNPGTSAVPDFYRDTIRPFVLGQFDVVSHLLRGSSDRYRRVQRAIEDQKRYLNEEERGVLAEVSSLVSRKHEVDAQYALQLALKGWLFFHVPATYALLIFAVFHGILVHAWFGGVR